MKDKSDKITQQHSIFSLVFTFLRLVYQGSSLYQHAKIWVVTEPIINHKDNNK